MKGAAWKLAGAVVCIVLGWTGSNIYHAAKFERLMEQNEELKTIVNSRELALAQFRAQSEEELAILRGMVTSAHGIISGLEEENDGLKETESAQAEEINELRTAEVVELLERYPALKAYDLAKDRLIETKDKRIFNLSQQGAEKDKIIEAQGKQILLEREIGLSWKKQFEDQQALRTAQEAAFAHYRRSASGSKLLWTVGALAVGFLAGEISH